MIYSPHVHPISFISQVPAATATALQILIGVRCDRTGDLPACVHSVMTASRPSEADLPTLFDPVSLVKKGLCPVTKIRYGGDPLESHSLYYEQHGTGKEKIVFIMG